VAQKWEPNADESFLGLGQHQFGLVDIKGYDLDLWQHNTSIAIPFLVSTKGYGILWDNCSNTRWGDTRPMEPIPAMQLIDKDGTRGALTGSYFSGQDFTKLVTTRRDALFAFRLPNQNEGANALKLPDGEACIRWEGKLEARESGDYQLKAYFDGAFKLWIDDKLLIDHWRQDWLAAEDLVKVRLEAGSRHDIRMEWIRDRNSTSLNLVWKTPSADKDSALWSEVGDGLDYYFILGPSLDKVVAGYRQITGRATMMPRWAFGLWQSRERYETDKQSIEVVDEFRKRGIPFDNIVQDWQYWRRDQWGSHQFDPTRFPDPAGWVKAIHDRHAQVMISVWGKFYADTDNYKEMLKAGFLFEPNIKAKDLDFLGFRFAYVDAFNPAAREMFWRQIKTRIFSTGVDAWWMDASEPDLTTRPDLADQKAHINPNYLGTGSRMLLGYPLMIAKAVYEGQRHDAPDQRVFNLTRSGYLGLQRYGAASWSGDITSTWTAMKKQIAAGLGYSISGLPYWTMDAGGFSVPARFNPELREKAALDEWRELNTRWFEFATFVPFLRVHGQNPRREMWYFGDKGDPAYDAMLASDRLRYRLLPYIYSLAGAVTQDGASIMRPLAMDFPGDAEACSLADQYLFGPAFLVNPVTTYKERSRDVLLPASEGGWYDFWTGALLGSGRHVSAGAPYERIPVMVRAGSIIPLGPELQYASEKAADPITLLVYAGRSGSFSVYEDDGVSNGYEKGAFSRILCSWDDSTKTITIGSREGSFPGMLAKRTFNVVLVSPDKAVPFSFDPVPAVTLDYEGKQVSHRF
jgi:alpha-D-xyloside xylohydrolase